MEAVLLLGPSIFPGLACSIFHPQWRLHVAQGFHDGNVDFEWRHGAVLTAKAKGLWTCKGDVTAEDIAHMKNRLSIYHAVDRVCLMSSKFHTTGVQMAIGALESGLIVSHSSERNLQQSSALSSRCSCGPMVP